VVQHALRLAALTTFIPEINYINGSVMIRTTADM